MGVFDFLSDFKFNSDPSTMDLAMLQMGAGMMSNANKGTSRALGAGISAGLNEYARGMQFAERQRANKAAEESRQRQLDIMAGQLAETTGYHQASLNQQRELSEQTAEARRKAAEARRRHEIALMEAEQAFNLPYKQAAAGLQSNQARLYGAKAEQAEFELQRFKDNYDKSMAKQKAEEALEKKRQEEEQKSRDFFSQYGPNSPSSRVRSAITQGTANPMAGALSLDLMKLMQLISEPSEEPSLWERFYGKRR